MEHHQTKLKSLEQNFPKITYQKHKKLLSSTALLIKKAAIYL